ncbi:MAG TPA: hypothetical protein VFS50_08805 [Meiothermus sp.]|nr:hypothetical protein [Meiothermus sp.]
MAARGTIRTLRPILFSNAPASWPKVRMPELPPERSLASESVARLSFLSALGESFEGSGIEVRELDAVRLTPEGLVEVPLRLDSPEGEFDVFFYPEATPQAAAHYWALQELAGRWRRLRPLYYCFENLPRLYPSPPYPLRVAHCDRLQVRPAEKPPSGQYAMWWATYPGESFRESPAFGLYEQIYRELSGLEAQGFALILLELGLIERPQDFTGLSHPERLEVPVEGPEGLQLLASFVDGRGVRFHFPVQSTPPEYRDAFLNLFLGRVQGWKRQNPAPLKESKAYAWWKSLGERLEASEEGLEAVGSLTR